ncbi:MAG: FAD-dependent monooxygenase [Pseudomonadota bacterium]
MVQTAVVVGAGIGGLAVATALAQRGIAVTVVEQANEISEVGAGLQISPNGLAVLEALGVTPGLHARNAVVGEAVVLEDFRQGREVARLDLTRLQDRAYLFVHRADLVNALVDAAQKADVALVLGDRAVKVEPGPKPFAVFEGRGTERSDLIVCADGLHSVGRPAVTGQSAAEFTGQVAWRATVPATTSDARVHVTMGPGRHIVRYPIRGKRVLNLVALQERRGWAEEGWHHLDDPANLRAAFADFGGDVSSVLERVDKVHLWGLFRHPVAETWARNGAALLGDAAHPTLPFLAQGANLALEDAWVLAASVVSGAGLDRYQSLRKARVTRVIKAASANAWKYHLRPGPFRWAAHRALQLGSRAAPDRMVRQFDWIYGYDATRVEP